MLCAKLICKSFVAFICFMLPFTKIEKNVSLTVQKSCQTPIAHVLVNQNALTFFHTIPNQINKVPMMQPAKQSYLQIRCSHDCTLISSLENYFTQIKGTCFAHSMFLWRQIMFQFLRQSVFHHSRT